MAANETSLTGVVRGLNVVVRHGLRPEKLDEFGELSAVATEIAGAKSDDAVERLMRVEGCLRQALAQMPDRRAAEAGSILLGLAPGTGGTSVTDREQLAARVYGIQGDSFRRLRRGQVLNSTALELGKMARAAAASREPRLLRRLFGRASLPAIARVPMSVESVADAYLAVDPANDPMAYTELLLGLVAGRNPAEVQVDTLDHIAEFARLSDAALRWKPDASSWSVIELLGHFLDSELNAAFRYRIVLAHEGPLLPSYYQEEWVSRLHYRDQHYSEVVPLFSALRHANLALWNTLTEEERDRFGVHEERGPETIDTIFRMQSGHDLMHLTQIGEVLALLPAAS